MAWRDRLRDLSILYSLADDLKLFWQLKNVRWDKLEAKLRFVEELKLGSTLVDEEILARHVKQSLLADTDYRETRHRIRVQLKEVVDILRFIDEPFPDALRQFTFKPLLLSNDVIEAGVDAVVALIPTVRHANYLKGYLRRGRHAPRQLIDDAWSFYLR